MSRATQRRGRMGARRWHRWLGIIFMLPLLWLTVSGLALRYAEELGLDEAMVESRWVLERYGMFPQGDVREAVTEAATVGEWEEVLFLAGRMLEEQGRLRGAVSWGNKVVLATGESLLVYDASGHWEQKLGEESLPGLPVEQIGKTKAGAVALNAGGKVWVFDEELIGLEELPGGEAEWSAVREGGAEARARLERAIAGQAGIPWSRVMLDLHSGNLGGTTGKLLVDLTGIGIILLTLMGARLVFRKPRGGVGS